MKARSVRVRLFRWLMAPLVLALVVTQAAPPARAEDTSAEIQKAQAELEAIKARKAQAENEFKAVAAAAEEADVQLEIVSKEVTETDAQLAVITNQKVQAEADLNKIQEDLKKAQAQFDKRKAVLATRVRSIQEQGRISYMAVLFGATTFSDFISRFELLKLIVQQDTKLFGQIRQEKAALEDKKTQAVTRSNQLDVLRAQAVERKQVAEAKRDEREKVSRSLDINKRRLTEQMDAYDREVAKTWQRIEALVQASQRKRTGAFSPIPPVDHVLLTDTFGPRMHPILGVPRWHYGTDFAVSMGDPVHAIESGVVVKAGWDDAFGNLVVIDHGGGFTSWYGHSSKLLVSEGQQVTQGQQISKAGSTGWSTGPHVHLEIHKNGTPVNPEDYLNL